MERKIKEKPNVWDILRKHFPFNEYALMEEVRDAAGFNASSSADFVAVNLWPSRGLHVSGIELKSYRSDWLSEKKKPGKAENIFQYCDFFWLLTSEEGIAKIEEIPETWGWMSIKSNKITIMKPAPRLTPIPMSRDFVCTMLKRATDKSHYVRLDSINDRLKEAKDDGALYAKRRVDDLESELQNIRKSVNEFYQASGIDLKYGWADNSKKMGDAVRFLSNGGTEKVKEDLIALEAKAELIFNQIKKAMEAF